MMLKVLQILFDGNFVSNGYNHLWESSIFRLQGASNFIIILSYFSIFLILVYVLRQRADIPSEEALQQAKNGLEIRVEERTQELRQALAELKDVILQLQWEIGQRQKVEASLREREEQYRSVVDNVKEVIFQTDVQGYWTFLNPAWSQITDFAIADSLGTFFLDYVHPDDRQRNLDAFQILIAGKQAYCRHEVRYRTACDTYRWIEVFTQLTFDANRTITGTCGTLHDITERHLGEAALAERERYLAALVEVQRCLLTFEGDTQYRHTSANPYTQILKLLGQVSGASRVYVFENHQDGAGRLYMSQRAEWCAAGIAPEIDNPDLQNCPYDQFFPRWGQVLAEGEVICGKVADFPVEERLILEPQGILSMLVLPLLVNNQFFGFIGFDECVSCRTWEPLEIDLLRSAAAAISLRQERKLALSALSESENKYRYVVNNLREVIFQRDVDGCWTFLNPAWTEITGYEIKESLGRHFLEFIHPDDHSLTLNQFGALMSSQVDCTRYEVRCRTKNGSYRWIEVQGRVNKAGDGTFLGSSGTLNDITDRKRIEQAIEQERQQLRQIITNAPVAIAMSVVWPKGRAGSNTSAIN